MWILRQAKAVERSGGGVAALRRTTDFEDLRRHGAKVAFTHGIIQVKTYACRYTIIPTITVRKIECLRVKRNRVPSSPTMPQAAVATARDWGEIILPMTPPLVLAAPVRIGLSPSCSAVAFCRPPKRTLLEVSEPVRNTPSQPRNGAMNGNQCPVLVKTRPRQLVMPEVFMT